MRLPRQSSLFHKFMFFNKCRGSNQAKLPCVLRFRKAQHARVRTRISAKHSPIEATWQVVTLVLIVLYYLLTVRLYTDTNLLFFGGGKTRGDDTLSRLIHSHFDMPPPCSYLGTHQRIWSRHMDLAIVSFWRSGMIITLSYVFFHASMRHRTTCWRPRLLS